jgi:hypothetical protein
MNVSLNLLVRNLFFLKLYLDVTLGSSKLRSLCPNSSFKIEAKSLLNRSPLRTYKVFSPNMSSL